MNSSKIIDGKVVASELRQKIKSLGSDFIESVKSTPGLAVVLVGENPASQVYVRNKISQTKEVGFISYEYKYPENVSEEELLNLIKRLNSDLAINGILVQLPLPKHIDSVKVLDMICPSKDVDGFHAINVGKLWTGLDALIPCTPLGCSILIKRELGDISGANAVVIGRSDIVGKPMSSLLLKANASVTIVHSKTKDIESVCSKADILVAAVGVPNMVRGSWVKKGATVIDVGINRIEVDGKKRLVGDVDYENVLGVAGKITPVPGGVGPMTIACLLLNTLNAARAQHKMDAIKLDSLF